MLPNILRSKGNQTMKFAQLIKYNMRNTFLKKILQKCGEETISEHFSKKSRFNISLDQEFNVLHSLLLLYAKLRAIEIY